MNCCIITLMIESAKFIDYYKLLGVTTNAEPAQIRTAFMRLAKQHHPDVGGSTEQMQQFTAAYRTLMSASSRRAYDLLHDFQTGTATIHYQPDGKPSAGDGLDDLSDDEIDDFLDTIYAEYRDQPKPKTTLFTKLRRMI